MENKTKRYINILAEKFNHTIGYDKEALLIKGVLNELRIESRGKNNFIVSYNQRKGIKTIKILDNEVFDILLQLFWRNDLDEIQLKSGELLNWELFKEIEGAFWDSYLLKLKKKVDEKGTKNIEVGGNRILLEYLNGLLIMVDDLGFYKTNVMELQSLIEVRK